MSERLPITSPSSYAVVMIEGDRRREASQDDLAYYEKRARQERAAATAAATPEVESIHCRLAILYEDAVRTLRELPAAKE